MPSMSRSFAALSALTLLASCSPPSIEISIAEKSRQSVVTLSQQWGWIFSDRKAPCVYRISLYRGDKEDTQPVWEAEAEGDVQCVHDLSSFVIGQAPAGFASTVPWQRSTKGPHHLLVYGIGEGRASITLP